MLGKVDIMNEIGIPEGTTTTIQEILDWTCKTLCLTRERCVEVRANPEYCAARQHLKSMIEHLERG